MALSVQSGAEPGGSILQTLPQPLGTFAVMFVVVTTKRRPEASNCVNIGLSDCEPAFPQFVFDVKA